MRAFVILLCLFVSLSLCAQTQPSSTQDKPSGSQQSQTPKTPKSAQQPLSPRGQAEFSFADGKKVTVDYGRPSMRGRQIMGGLVPYGQVWRTGANAATSFVTQADLDLGGAKVPAGEYTLYTLPGQDSWAIIINRQTGQWGTVYNQSEDLVRINVRPTHLEQPVEQFTISFQNRGPNAGVMQLEWENTSVPVTFNEAKAK